MTEPDKPVQRRKPRLSVWKFASCDGCQLSLLDCETDLLTLAGEIEIAYFREATRAEDEGPYDLSLVEGSISVPDHIDEVRKIREKSRFLVTIGACATSGGIQALRNFRDHTEFLETVYAKPEYINTLATSTPIAEHVPVDFELRGCPVSKRQLIEVITAFLHRRKPQVPAYSVCTECKRRVTTCVMVADGTPCLGPVTHAGCGAVCPAYRRPCYGCFGPMETPNTQAMARAFAAAGRTDRQIHDVFQTFQANAPAFREEAVTHDDTND